MKNAIDALRRLGNKALDALYPPSLYCVCGGNIIDGSRSYSLCDHCVRRIQWTLDEQRTSVGLRLITCLNTASMRGA